MAEDQHDQETAARRRGRRAGTVLLGVIVTTFTAVCSVQIIEQAWARPESPAPLDCRDGLHDLIAAVKRAREAAATVTGGEREAIAQFRHALEPEWSMRPGLADRCKADPRALGALEELDRLRFAEEHALRYEAVDVASRRRRVDALSRELPRSK